MHLTHASIITHYTYVESRPRPDYIADLNSGLGALISTTFAQHGCNIAINYFNRLEPAQKVQKECEGFGVKAVLVKAVGITLPPAPGIMSRVLFCANIWFYV
jgi:hypothetical protein